MDCTKVSLKPPHSDDHGRWHALLLLYPGEDRGILFHHGLPFVQSTGIHHTARELLKALPEHMLAMILRNDPRIIGDAVKRADRRRGNALGCGLSLEVPKPRVETRRIATGCGFNRSEPKETKTE